MPLLSFENLKLGRRIVALMILGNLLLSTIATGIQLAVSYESGKGEIGKVFDVIDDSFRESLSVALWKFDFQQTEILIDGILAKSDVQFLRLEASSGQVWVRGDSEPPADLTRTISIVFSQGDGTIREVGKMVLGITYQNLRQRVWDQFAVLVVSNFIKTLIASLIMLLIFDRLVARHLRYLSERLRAGFMQQGDKNLELARSRPDSPDELEQITSALNKAKAETSAAYRELARINSDLEDANREQAEFTYAISHDLKSPMNTLQLLLDELGVAEGEELSDDTRELIDDAHRTANRMRRLIDDVLSYARTVGTEAAFEHVDLSEAIADVLRDLNGEVQHSNAKITVGKMPTLLASPIQMRLLFQNLISNAIKFTKPGDVPNIRIEASAHPSGRGVEITVADQGIGIAPEHQGQIFGMFQKLHSEKSFPGSGLGLTLCSRIVTNHSGVLTVASTLGAGTKFSIALPGEFA